MAVLDRLLFEGRRERARTFHDDLAAQLALFPPHTGPRANEQRAGPTIVEYGGFGQAVGARKSDQLDLR